MEPVRGESCLSSQRRGRAAHEKDAVPAPDQKSFYICPNLTNRGPRR